MRCPSDLQIYYQRNMLYAMLIMTILILSLALYLATFTQSSSPEDNSNTFISPLVQNQHFNRSAKKSETINAIRSLKKLNPYVSLHDGFMGFLNIIPTYKMPLSLPISQPVYSLDNTMDEIDDIPISFSILEGNDTGIYITGDGDYLFPYKKKIRLNNFFNREIEVLRHVDPEYPWVAIEAGKEGVMTTLVYLDSLGFLVSFPDWIVADGAKSFKYTINGKVRTAQYAFIEEPQGWFFAENFIKVLPKWRFSPRIQNGKPVASLLRIKYTFCLMTNCLIYELEVLKSSNLKM